MDRQIRYFMYILILYIFDSINKLFVYTLFIILQ